MTKRYLKKDREYFVKEMAAFFRQYAHKIEKQDYLEDLKLHPYKYYLKTPFGEYEVRSIDPSDNILSIMGAFREKEYFPALKENGFDCNPFTGKWNFHLNPENAREAVHHIQTWFDRLLRHNQWPVNHEPPNQDLKDARYSVTREFTGRPHKSYVFRFCDDFVSAHETEEDAVDAALKYQKNRSCK